MSRERIGRNGGLHACEAAQEIVGGITLAALLGVDAGHRALERARGEGLLPEHFERPSDGFLFALLCELADAGQPLDPLAVAHEVERRMQEGVPVELAGVDWPTLYGRIVALAAGTSYVGAIEHRARLVIDAATQREQELAERRA